jgi:hypothetical protein
MMMMISSVVLSMLNPPLATSVVPSSGEANQRPGALPHGFSHPDFKWWQPGLGPKDPPRGPAPDGVQGAPGRPVARHPGRYLHLMFSRAEGAHAIAYEHDQLGKGLSRFRIADANNGQFLCNSAMSFMDFNSAFFRQRGYRLVS